jgi:hypothetical protein
MFLWLNCGYFWHGVAAFDLPFVQLVLAAASSAGAKDLRCSTGCSFRGGVSRAGLECRTHDEQNNSHRVCDGQLPPCAAHWVIT